MDIWELTNQLNESAGNYETGAIQNIRKKLKGLKKKLNNKIFSDVTISDDGWAFHHGGRSEMQFNFLWDYGGEKWIIRAER